MIFLKGRVERIREKSPVWEDLECREWKRRWNGGSGRVVKEGMKEKK